LDKGRATGRIDSFQAMAQAFLVAAQAVDDLVLYTFGEHTLNAL
jgi:hypothetical protein